MIKVKIAKKTNKPMIRSYNFIKNKSGSYKCCNTDSYFISDGVDSLLCFDKHGYACQAINEIWKNREFIEIDCIIKFIEKN